MTRFALIAALVLPALQPARAYLDQSKAQLEQRWGAPVRIEGFPDERVYTYDAGLLQVRVIYLEGRSESEDYRHADRKPLLPGEVTELLALNSLGQEWQEKNGSYELPHHYAWASSIKSGSGISAILFSTAKYNAAALQKKPAARTGARKVISGAIALRRVENAEWVVVHDGDRVLEMAWAINNYRDAPAVMRAGETYDFILRDAEGVDIESRTASLSDREHKDWEDLVDDSRTYLLDRIQQGGKVLFDRTICEVHHAKMTAKQVDIVYGLTGMNECDRRFPHHRDYILGGCLRGEEKTAWLYICPKCMAACADYRRAHPEQFR